MNKIQAAALILTKNEAAAASSARQSQQGLPRALLAPTVEEAEGGARAAETAYSSNLPKAKVVLPSLEYAAGRVLSLVRLIEAIPGRAEWASLPTPRPKPSLALVAPLGTVLILTASASRPRASRPALSSCRRCLEVLRC